MEDQKQNKYRILHCLEEENHENETWKTQRKKTFKATEKEGVSLKLYKKNNTLI